MRAPPLDFAKYQQRQFPCTLNSLAGFCCSPLSKKEKAIGYLRHSDARFGGGLESAMRTFSLAQDIDEAKLKAQFQDGVLMLELPEKAGRASHKFAIQ